MMTRARLTVDRDYFEGKNLPPGFSEVWCKTIAPDRLELVVDGPFDPSLPDGAEVSANITAVTDAPRHLKWQWKHDGQDCGTPIEMPWPAWMP
jgi:hypothetical protein